MPDFGLRLLSTTALLLLGPVLLLQGRRVRRVTPRLPEAGGVRKGTTHEGAGPIRLLVAGESTAVGVGVSDQRVGLAGQMARALSTVAGRPVAWRVIGRSGATARVLLKEFVQPAARLDADLVVIVLGVNDTLGLSSPARWIASLEALRASLQPSAARGAPGERSTAKAYPPILVTAVPPMQYFPALPAPLRHVLGLRAYMLDRAAAEWARASSAVMHVPHTPFLGGDAPDLFAADGFHPSAIGYERWGTTLAEAAVKALA